MDPDKRVYVHGHAAIDDDALAKLGTGAGEGRQSDHAARVPSARCPAWSATPRSSELKVADLGIEDPPLEDVLRAMFGKSREASP